MKSLSSLIKSIILPVAVLFLILFFVATRADAALNFESKESKVLATNIAGAAIISSWGFMSWDYGTNTPHFTKERYFDRNTSHGGADKMGHFYTNYVLTELLSGQFRAWGYSTPHAAKLGFWSGLGLLAFVELGDSVSDYGFSYQDFVMDSLGSVMGYLRFTQPQLAGMLDIRVEYIPTFNTGDFFTDYEGLKYLFAFKLKSINSLAHSHFNLLELQLGYYTRGYEHITNYKQTQRNVFFAIGINISETLRTVFNTKRQYKLFQYIQPPYTHLAIARDLNKL